MKPRIFLSAVSRELGQARQLAANILTRLGYEPVWQDIFGTEPGDLRAMLRDKIDSCQGLVHLVGRAYGAEPPTPTPAFRRVSYTQYEFLYAQSLGPKRIKTWIVFAEDGYPPDRPLAELDLPPASSRDVAAHPDSAAYQAERRALQEVWRRRLRGDGHLWHSAEDVKELRLAIEGLRDDGAELRKAFDAWRQDVSEKLESVERRVAQMEPERVKSHLREQIEETYRRDVAEADALPDWRQRDDARKSAGEIRDRRLGEVDEFLNSITRTLRSGDASPEFLELTRILESEGVSDALEYIDSQQSRLFDRAESLLAKQRREIRRTLLPLLEGARLRKTRGEMIDARERCERLLAIDGEWPEALHEQLWIDVELGDRDLRYATTREALAKFEAAAKAGRKLASIDPKSPAWQRDLSVSYERLGYTSAQQGDLAAARWFYEQCHEILQRLAQADPQNAQAQRDLSVSYDKLGETSAQQGDLAAARRFYEQALEISQRLAQADPQNAQAQRDLMISHYKLGELEMQRDKPGAAIEQFQAGVAALDAMIGKGQSVDASTREKAVLERRIEACRQALSKE